MLIQIYMECCGETAGPAELDGEIMGMGAGAYSSLGELKKYINKESSTKRD